MDLLTFRSGLCRSSAWSRHTCQASIESCNRKVQPGWQGLRGGLQHACATQLLTLRLTAPRLSVARQLSALTSCLTTNFFLLLFHSSAQYYASRMVHFDSHNQRQWYEMSWSSMVWLSILLAPVLVTGQQECYFGPGATNRGPSNLVPCNGTGTSTCCLLGDTCLSGNACYNYATGDLYQYGCTDITYEDETCPYKCGWNPSMLVCSFVLLYRS